MNLDFSFIDHSHLQDIADAIRFVEGSTSSIAPSDYPNRIRALDKYIPDYDVLNFTLPNGGTISLNKINTPTVVELEYWLDENRQWIIWQPDSKGNRSLTLTAGQRIYIRNTSDTQTGFSTYNNKQYQFACQDDIVVQGIIESLICKEPRKVTRANAWSFNNLLPIPTLSGVVTSVSTIISYRSYYLTFFGAKLNGFIFENATTLETEALAAWMASVNTTGDFYCPAELTIPTGVSGIPEGWTRHDLT